MTDATIAERRLSFYGGPLISILPFVVFMIGVVVFVVQDAATPEALWVSSTIGMLLVFFLTRNKTDYGDAIASGIADKLTAYPILCWIFAAVFGQTLQAAGLVEGLVWGAHAIGATGAIFSLIAFVVSTLFATATGTGFGTTVVGFTVLYPAGVLLGADPFMLAGVIIGGSAFGDNMAPISDTTIVSSMTQGADISGVVRSRFKYVAVAFSITAIATGIFGSSGSDAQSVPQDILDGYTNPLGLLMLVPAGVAIFLAFKKNDIVYATSVGSVLVIVFGLISGTMSFADVVSIDDEGMVSGSVFEGISGVVNIIILSLTVMGMVGIMNRGGGSEFIISKTSKIVRGATGAELSIFGSVLGLSLFTNNTSAILALGVPYAKPLGERFHLHPYRRANILDTTACSLAYIVPFGSVPLVMASLTSAANDKYGDLIPALDSIVALKYGIYGWSLFGVMLVTILTGWGRRFVDSSGAVTKVNPLKSR